MIRLKNKFTEEVIEEYPLVHGERLIDWLSREIDHFESRECPPISICINDQLTLQRGWKRVMRQGDEIEIFSEPKTGIEVFILKAVLGAVISYAISELTAPEVPDNYASTAPAGSRIYSANGQGNTPRLNGVIPVQFGLHKYFPDNLSQPWRAYHALEQYLYMSLCCGVGEFEVQSINIGNTSIVAGLDGAMYDTSGGFTYTDPDGNYELEYYPPGALISNSSNKARKNIYTSREVGSSGSGAGFDLKAETASGEVVGPFNATPAGTGATKIYLDFQFPNGLGQVNADGTVSDVTVYLKLFWRELGTTNWNTLNMGWMFNRVDQLGYTREVTISSTPIEVEVKMQRTTIESTDSAVRDKVQWTGLKAELEGESFYSDVSVLLLKIKGTNLASSASNRINVVQRRKLPNYDEVAGAWLPYTGSNPTLAPGIVDPSSARLAALHVMVDAGLSVTDQIDFEGLALLNDYHFDAVFDESSTLYESLSRIAAVAYCYPAIESGKVTFVSDQPRQSLGQFFSPDNTISITESGSLFDPSEADGTRVEYFDSETWKSEVVDCLLDDGVTVDAGIAPKEIRGFGITDKLAAYRFGMRDRRQRRYLRRTWEIETEWEGLNCALGERVSLAGRDVQHGALVDFVQSQYGGKPIITTDRPLTYDSNLNYWIVFRGNEGTVTGFMRAFPINEYTLELEFGMSTTPVVSSNEDPILFKFGTYEQIHIPAIVKSIEPQGDIVRLELAAYDERVYLDDGVTSVPGV